MIAKKDLKADLQSDRHCFLERTLRYDQSRFKKNLIAIGMIIMIVFRTEFAAISPRDVSQLFFGMT